MLQAAAFTVGFMAIFIGAYGLKTGGLQFSSETPLVGRSATIASVITIVVGVAIVGFALIGIPLLSR